MNKKEAIKKLIIDLNVDISNQRDLLLLLASMEYADINNQFVAEPKTREDQSTNEIFFIKAQSHYKFHRASDAKDRKWVKDWEFRTIASIKMQYNIF